MGATTAGWNPGLIAIAGRIGTLPVDVGGEWLDPTFTMYRRNFG